jgi:hypothetical protein
MPVTNIKDRLTSLYKLREQLCNKQKNQMQLEEIKAWMVSQLKYLKALANNENVTNDEICIRIEDIICALDINGEHDE